MPTKNNLPESVRVEMAALLNARLADAIDFFNQTKHAHWNVKGPNFIALHELFDQITPELVGPFKGEPGSEGWCSTLDPATREPYFGPAPSTVISFVRRGSEARPVPT